MDDEQILKDKEIKQFKKTEINDEIKKDELSSDNEEN